MSRKYYFTTILTSRNITAMLISAMERDVDVMNYSVTEGRGQRPDTITSSVQRQERGVDGSSLQDVQKKNITPSSRNQHKERYKVAIQFSAGEGESSEQMAITSASNDFNGHNSAHRFQQTTIDVQSCSTSRQGQCTDRMLNLTSFADEQVIVSPTATEIRRSLQSINPGTGNLQISTNAHLPPHHDEISLLQNLVSKILPEQRVVQLKSRDTDIVAHNQPINVSDGTTRAGSKAGGDETHIVSVNKHLGYTDPKRGLKRNEEANHCPYQDDGNSANSIESVPGKTSLTVIPPVVDSDTGDMVDVERQRERSPNQSENRTESYSRGAKDKASRRRLYTRNYSKLTNTTLSSSDSKTVQLLTDFCSSSRNYIIKCEICEEKFSIIDIEEHLSEHIDVWTVKCTLCESRFTHQKYLNFHMENHKGLNNFEFIRVSDDVPRTGSEIGGGPSFSGSNDKCVTVLPSVCNTEVMVNIETRHKRYPNQSENQSDPSIRGSKDKDVIETCHERCPNQAEPSFRVNNDKCVTVLPSVCNTEVMVNIETRHKRYPNQSENQSDPSFRGSKDKGLIETCHEGCQNQAEPSFRVNNDKGVSNQTQHQPILSNLGYFSSPGVYSNVSKYVQLLTDFCSNMRKYIITCEVCEQKFTSIAKMEEHLSEHIDVWTVKCTLCESRFTHKKYLNFHMENHKGLKNFVCDVCGKSYPTSRKLTIHRKLKHGVGAFKMQCPECDKKYVLGKFEEHSRENHKGYAKDGEQGYNCEVCSRRFKCQSRLELHKRVHLKESNFLCFHCGKGCKTRGALREHIKKHDPDYEEKKIQCKVCDKRINKVSMSQHMKTHTSKRTFQCEVCGDSFKLKHHLASHMKSAHQDERPYVCDICQASFKLSFHLTGHRKTHGVLV